MTSYTADATAENIGRRVKAMGLKSVVVKANGFTHFKKKRNAIVAFRSGYSSSRNDQNPIVYIEDTTRKAHNGCRLPRKRREEFEEQAEKVKKLTASPSNEDLLILYGLYKQATVGPVTTSRPGMFSMKERAKWDAWKAVEGKSTDEAMSDYITKVKQLLEAEASSASA
ncbi:hypothetical protein Bca52824_065427 [Brassica carinata]|nr:hypothetical protein Bca52824_065427 [Brassica carinata]